MLGQQILIVPQRIRKERVSRLLPLYLYLLFTVGSCSQYSKTTTSIWLPFNRNQVLQSIDNGEFVILFGNPLYSVDGEVMKNLLNTKKSVEKLKSSKAKLFYLEYSSKEPITEEFMQLTRRTYSPILVILHSSMVPKYFSIHELEKFEKSLAQLENL